jgi:Ca2+-binding EF-hand superfamily protein
MAVAVLSELRRRKLTRMFRLTDHDHSGGVERGDFERLALYSALDGGFEPDGPEHRRLSAGMAAHWERLCRAADRGGDGAISLDEYLRYFGDADNAVAWADDIGDVLMAMMDPKHDGRISRTEYIAGQAPLGPSDGDAANIFGRLDRDGDGYLSRDELVRALHEYFLADDPDAPGNELLGPLS